MYECQILFSDGASYNGEYYSPPSLLAKVNEFLFEAA